MIAHSVLTHAPSHRIGACLGEVAAAVSPAGIFVATFAAGEENHRGEV